MFEVEDDGRGVDWARVRQEAIERGLPCKTPADLEQALFTDGLTTRSEVTELSGRGAGMSAVAAHCRSIGGSLAVKSKPAAGTLVRVTLPLAQREAAA